MTENEAEEYLLNRYLVVGSPVNPPKEECERHNDVLDVAIYALEKVQAFEAIGTIEDFKALKEKSEPKKIIGIDSRMQSLHCPSCNNWFGIEIRKGMKFCPNCG